MTKEKRLPAVEDARVSSSQPEAEKRYDSDGDSGLDEGTHMPRHVPAQEEAEAEEQEPSAEDLASMFLTMVKEEQEGVHARSVLVYLDDVLMHDDEDVAHRARLEFGDAIVKVAKVNVRSVVQFDMVGCNAMRSHDGVVTRPEAVVIRFLQILMRAEADAHAVISRMQTIAQQKPRLHMVQFPRLCGGAWKTDRRVAHVGAFGQEAAIIQAADAASNIVRSTLCSCRPSGGCGVASCPSPLRGRPRHRRRVGRGPSLSVSLVGVGRGSRGGCPVGGLS
jgi:hypothetical protein